MKYKAWCLAGAVSFAACASVPSSSVGSLGEPTNRTQLWQHVGCPTNGLQQWRVVEMAPLRGVTVVKGSASPLRATVFLRAWPDGDVMKTAAVAAWAEGADVRASRLDMATPDHQVMRLIG